MSDPPKALKSDERGEVSSPAVGEGVEGSLVETEQKEELELVTDAYIRVTEVFYNWTKWLDPWQANAVKALTNPNSLTHPDHPLFLKVKGGLELYNCFKDDGYENLCFSLKQIEYLQYYIHEMRLAEPAWTIYLGKLSSANAEDQSTKENPLLPPPYIEEENAWVPMPSTITRASDLVDIVSYRLHEAVDRRGASSLQNKETVTIYEAREIKGFINAQRKRNKTTQREKNTMKPMTEDEKTREEALIDNARPGPGLRRGPQRQREQRSPRQPERTPGTGWGGFPLRTSDDLSRNATAPTTEPAEWKEGETVSETLDEEVSGKKTDITEEEEEVLAIPDDPSKNSEKQSAERTDCEDPETKPDELAKLLNRISELQPVVAETAETAKPDGETASPARSDPIEQYFYDAQQALALAGAGGLANAYEVKDGLDGSKTEEGKSEEGGEAPKIPPEIGRSLFFALRLTTWEENEDTVLELGWAATWWQETADSDAIEDIEADDKVKKKVDGAEAEVEEGFEQMTEYGHIIIQEHLLEKRNGKNKWDNRSSYHFGTSLPMSSSEALRTIKEKVRDLAKRAGSGPTYLLIHSSDSDETEFKKIGWKLNGWEAQIRPAGWEHASYASEEGVGKVFLLDTAILFGAIEDDQSIRPAPGKSRKSLETVTRITLGDDKEQIPGGFGNAGNDAAYCLRLFLEMAGGPSLEQLRAGYRGAQVQPVSDDLQDVMERKEKSKEGPADSVKVREIETDEDQEEEEEEGDEGIKGVFYKDSEGNIIEV